MIDLTNYQKQAKVYIVTNTIYNQPSGAGLKKYVNEKPSIRME